MPISVVVAPMELGLNSDQVEKFSDSTGLTKMKIIFRLVINRQIVNFEVIDGVSLVMGLDSVDSGYRLATIHVFRSSQAT